MSNKNAYTLLADLRQAVGLNVDPELLREIDEFLEFTPVVNVGVSYRVNSESEEELHVTSHVYAEVNGDELERMSDGNPITMFNATGTTFEEFDKLQESVKSQLSKLATMAQLMQGLLPDGEDEEADDEQV